MNIIIQKLKRIYWYINLINRTIFNHGLIKVTANKGQWEKRYPPLKSLNKTAKLFNQINGKVIQISPDTEQDENDKRIVFYKILVETEQGYFQSKNRIYQLVPGVKVVASIQIGQRTVANYLLSPFMGTMDQTFQER